VNISDILPHVKQMSASAPVQKDLCWIVRDGDEFHTDYCPECARKVVAWLRDGEGIEFEERREEFPTYSAIDREENYYARDYGGYGADGCRHCEHCGAHLDVSLTEYGVESELDHFEQCGIKDADDWRHFLDVCEAIKHVESSSFPGRWMKECEIELHRNLYTRTVAVAGKYLLQSAAELTLAPDERHG